jgi:co-chaperonin GroES (HSP10)
MEVVPQNEHILCEKLKQEDSQKDFFLYDKDEFPSYKVLRLGKGAEGCGLKAGDEVVCSTDGTKVKVDGSDFWLFKKENVIGKVSRA